MWEIFAYQSSDILYGIFNAVVATIGGDTYMGAMAIVGVCGFLAALFAYAFAPQKLEGWQWLASVTLVLSLMLVPRVTVGIVDKTGGSAEVVVDNVPLGLAAFGSISSTVGNALTEVVEMAFQAIPGSIGIPAELTYQNHGLLFGNRLIRETSGVVFQDAQFRADLLNFLNNCTMYDLASSSIDPETFANAGDVWPLLGNTNPARFSPVSDNAGGTVIVTCVEAFQRLNARIQAEIARLQNSLAVRLNPTLTPAMAGTLIAGQIEQAYIKMRIADAATSAASIIRQNAVINAINDTSMLAGQRINDQASLLMAVGRAQAVAQSNATGIANAKMAEEALPMFRNCIEAILYAIFPIAILLLMTTYGKATATALKGYIMVLIWIQLWPVLYAIMNYVGTLHAAKELAAASTALSGVNALALTTYSKVYSTALSGEAIVGYMSMSIPFLAWALMKPAQNLGTALLSGLSVIPARVSSAVSSAVEGNISGGNVSMDQMSLTPVRSSPFFSSRQNDDSGNTYTTNAVSGRTAVKAFANEGPASRTVETRITEDQVVAASASVAAAHADVVAARNETASVLADVVSRSSGTGRNNASSDGVRRSSGESVNERVGELAQIADQVAKQTGTTQQQVASVAFGGSARVGVNVPLVGGAGVDTRREKNYRAGIDQQEKAIDSALSSEDRAKFKAFQDSVTRDTGVIHQVFSDSRSGRELSARYSTALSKANQAEASLRQTQEYSERVSSAFSSGESITKDVAKEPENAAMFEDILRSEQGSTAERLKQESYLGNQAKTPTPVGKTMNLPSSFHDVIDQHNTNKRSPDISVDVRGNFDGNRALVRSAGPKAVGPAADPAQRESVTATGDTDKSNAFRDEVRAMGDRIEAEQHRRDAAARAQSGVQVGPHGELHTDKSLGQQADEQFKADRDVIVNRIHEFAKSPDVVAERVREWMGKNVKKDEPGEKK